MIPGTAARSFAADLSVSTDFPGGSAEVLEVDSQSRRIVIAPQVLSERGWPCWWYLRIDGATPGETITLQVDRAAKEFQPGRRLTANWSLPQRPAVSLDDIEWRHANAGELSAQGGVYKVDAPAERFWLAWGPPFLPAHAEALIARVVEKLPDARRFVLAETRQGRPVAGVRIGDGSQPQAIWVNARQHAWESGGSWVGQGFLEWVTSDDPAAVALRARTEIICIPIMDVDNVTLGAGGKDAIPRDHNRDWAEEPVYPEIAAAQKEIQALIAAGRLQLYLDLHNPGPSDKQPFYFGPYNYDTLPPVRRRAFDRFLELSIEEIRDPMVLHPKYRFATYVQSDEERGRMSSEWVRRRTEGAAIGLTLETSWNTPYSTIDGYLAVGEGLARAVARYLTPAVQE